MVVITNFLKRYKIGVILLIFPAVLLVQHLENTWKKSTQNNHIVELYSNQNIVSQGDYNFLSGEIGTISPNPLPSLRLSSSATALTTKLRKYYGGTGDKLHLGGFIDYDVEGVSNNTWNFMLGPLGIKSVIDLGCGRGISSDYFLTHGANVLCIEGSHDAIQKTLLPNKDNIIEHDFTRGPWWPNMTYDAVWCVEFLEHVGRQYAQNYFPVLRRSALIFVTASTTGGWHHVEVRENWWWKARFQAAKFVYSPELSELVRNSAKALENRLAGSRIANFMHVYINPEVASLPQHAHIFSGHGCIFGNETNIPCSERMKWFTEVDSVPFKYQSLLECKYISKSKTDRNGKEKIPGLGIYDCNRNKNSTVSLRDHISAVHEECHGLLHKSARSVTADKITDTNNQLKTPIAVPDSSLRSQRNLEMSLDMKTIGFKIKLEDQVDALEVLIILVIVDNNDLQILIENGPTVLIHSIIDFPPHTPQTANI
eukprot:gene9475-19681_t